MQTACVESFPDFRRYMKAKAKLLGKDALPWYDLGAPVGGSVRHWPWDDTETFIVDQFGTYSDRLATPRRPRVPRAVDRRRAARRASATAGSAWACTGTCPASS